MEDKFLPIGTVVNLKGATKRVMIAGFCPEVKGKIYDYSGTLFPEGLMGPDKTLLFNHEEIDKIHHKGLVDDEEKAFINRLNVTLEKIKSGELSVPSEEK